LSDPAIKSLSLEGKIEYLQDLHHSVSLLEGKTRSEGTSAWYHTHLPIKEKIKILQNIRIVDHTFVNIPLALFINDSPVFQRDGSDVLEMVEGADPMVACMLDDTGIDILASVKEMAE